MKFRTFDISDVKFPFMSRKYEAAPFAVAARAAPHNCLSRNWCARAGVGQEFARENRFKPADRIRNPATQYYDMHLALMKPIGIVRRSRSNGLGMKLLAPEERETCDTKSRHYSWYSLHITARRPSRSCLLNCIYSGFVSTLMLVGLSVATDLKATERFNTPLRDIAAS